MDAVPLSQNMHALRERRWRVCTCGAGLCGAATPATASGRKLHHLRGADPGEAFEQLSCGAPGAGDGSSARAGAATRLSSCWRRFMQNCSRLLPSLRRCGRITICTRRIFSGAIEATNAQPTAVIDFGLADRTNAVHDLAHAIERNIVEWLALMHDPTHPKTCRSISIICSRCSMVMNRCGHSQRRNQRRWRR